MYYLSPLPQPKSLTSKTKTFAARSKRVFKRLYPYATVSYELWLACWNMAYLFDRTPYYRPWLAWMRIDLRRAGPELVRAVIVLQPIHPHRPF